MLSERVHHEAPDHHMGVGRNLAYRIAFVIVIQMAPNNLTTIKQCYTRNFLYAWVTLQYRFNYPLLRLDM